MGDEQGHVDGEGCRVTRVLVRTLKWKDCGLLGCDDVFHITPQMPPQSWHLMQDESGFAVGNHPLPAREVLGRLDRAGSAGSVMAPTRITLTVGKGIFKIRFLLGI